MKNDMIGLIALILLVIGGINWGLVGIADLNLVSSIFGSTLITKLVYDLVGLSALYVAYTTWLKK